MTSPSATIRTFKVITLGPPSVGKTCILMKAVNEDFILPTTYMCTLGVDFKVKSMVHAGQTVKLHIWDTAGQERFLHINRMYYRDSNAVLFVYDVCDVKSFESVEYFWNDYRDHQAANAQVVMVLVGNKTDRVRDRTVGTEQGAELAKKLGALFLETSAKSGENVSKVFEMVVEKLMTSPSEDKSIGSRLEQDLRNRSGCCK